MTPINRITLAPGERWEANLSLLRLSGSICDNLNATQALRIESGSASFQTYLTIPELRALAHFFTCAADQAEITPTTNSEANDD